MSRTITIPADVVPLVYSGLQLDIWQRVMPELDELFVRKGRVGHPEWFTEPFEPHREVLLSALQAELQMQRDLRDTNENVELLEESLWAVSFIEDFLAGLPDVEVEAGAAL
jgi:hypothetical protein